MSFLTDCNPFLDLKQLEASVTNTIFTISKIVTCDMLFLTNFVALNYPINRSKNITFLFMSIIIKKQFAYTHLQGSTLGDLTNVYYVKKLNFKMAKHWVSKYFFKIFLTTSKMINVNNTINLI